MLRMPMLRGKSGSLRALKNHINGECKQLDRARLLSVGSGSGPARRHEINPMLGSLRDLVIATARSFEIDWQLLESPAACNSQIADPLTERSLSPASASAPRSPAASRAKAWYVTHQTGGLEIAAFVNAKGACSYRRFKTSGEFINRQRSKGEFSNVFSTVIARGVRFFPNAHPVLEHAERNGLPAEVLDAANEVLK